MQVGDPAGSASGSSRRTNVRIGDSSARHGSLNAPGRPYLTIGTGAIRILVVEDDIGIRGFVEKVLVLDGHDVVVAANGREAMRALDHSVFSLVVTDVCMPEADGLELLRELRKRPSAPQVIAMSGGGSRGAGGQYLALAAAFGAVATLRKPFSIAQLLGVVRERDLVQQGL